MTQKNKSRLILAGAFLAASVSVFGFVLDSKRPHKETAEEARERRDAESEEMMDDYLQQFQKAADEIHDRDYKLFKERKAREAAKK